MRNITDFKDTLYAINVAVNFYGKRGRGPAEALTFRFAIHEPFYFFDYKRPVTKLLCAFPQRNSLDGSSSRDSSDGIFILTTDVTRSIESFNKRHAYQTMGAGVGGRSSLSRFSLLSQSRCDKRPVSVKTAAQRPRFLFFLSLSLSLLTLYTPSKSCETVDSSADVIFFPPRDENTT